MSWVRLDDGFAEHPKVLKIGPIALAVHIWGLCYCARFLTDGRVSREALAGTPWVSKRSARENALGRLVGAGLWEETEDGYTIHDYLTFNPDAAAVLEKRRQAAERQAHWRERMEQRRNARSNAVTGDERNAVTNDSPTPPPKARVGAHALEAAPPTIEDHCGGCGEKRVLVDEIYCAECKATVITT